MKLYKANTPLDGLAGLKQNYRTDAMSGFLVFLLAMPLSLGIAKASDFPAVMGLLTAMIGGLIVSFFSGSFLTIKGPAAGLIVIVAGSVAELGQGNNEQGWHLALGAIVVAGIVQILFGLLKFGKLSDFFPFSAVEGMLAAIGIIIISKQLHILLGVNPVNEAGAPLVDPFELIMALPSTFMHINKASAIIGLISLSIVLFYPLLKFPFAKKVPAALVVLLVAIPLGILLNLKTENPKGLVHFDKGLFDILAINVSFAGVSSIGAFIKYVIMFALVGSLEALLTNKAIDNLDPYGRKSDMNKDLIALGIGNIIAGVLGGLPMISEVARSSNNVNNGAKTRWANFFHGVFIMVFLMLATVFSDLIPGAALSALLIGVGIKLASPKLFGHVSHVGKEQLAIFLVTILVTLATDLLVGIFAGIIVKLIIELFEGAKLKYMFRNNFSVMQVSEGKRVVKVDNCAVFTNVITLKQTLEKIPAKEEIIIDFSGARVIDHTSLCVLKQFQSQYELKEGRVEVTGINHHARLGHDETSTLILK